MYIVGFLKTETDWQLPSRLVFLFWSFHIWYKVMSHTCYIFSPFFLFHCFRQVATNFTLTSETSVTLLFLRCLPSNAKKKLIVKIVEHKLGAFFDGLRRYVQLGHFILLSVPISQQLPRLTSFYFFSFLKWPLKLDCTFRWQVTWFWKNNPFWKLEILLLQVTSYKAPFMQFSL